MHRSISARPHGARVHAMPINWSDGKFAENGARAFAEHLLDIAAASLSSDVPTDEDRAELERHSKKLEHSFREMLKVIDDLEKTKPSVAFHGRICLWDLMASAFIIGSRGTVTDSAKNFFRAGIETETMATQARRASAGNEAKAEARNRTLDDAIVAVAKEQGRTLYISEKFAKQVRPGVAKRLAPDSPPSDPLAKPLKLSDTTMKKAVRRILKKGQLFKSCP